MKNIRITKNVALKAMKQAMDERGEEFRFTDMFEEGIGCFYSGHPKDAPLDACGEPLTDPVPACLVGLAFHYIDPDLDAFLREPGTNDESIAGVFGGDRYHPDRAPAETTVTLDEGVQITITRKAIMALTAAQESQDGGSTWGVAFERAVKSVS